MSWAEAGEPTPRPQPGAPGLEPGRLAAGAERRIAAPPSVVRQHLLRTIRELSFELKIEQFSLLEAVRGSRFGGVTLTASRVPVVLRIGLEADGTGSRIAVLLTDRWPGKMGRNWGVTSVYVELFGSVLTAVDAALGRLDPAAVATFPRWWRETGPGDVAMMQNAASLAGKAQAVLSRHTSRLLDGDAGAPRQAVVSRSGGGTFTFETPQATAEVPAELADGMLMVGTLIAGRPGGMPPKLVAQVQSLVFRIEEHLSSTAGPPPGTGVRFAVEAADVPVVTFLHQQARLRSLLPVRTLRTCTTCRLEKVTNPEMERMQERTRRTRDLASSLTAVVTPYVLAGRLVQLNNKGPEFACPRCQGMDADETVVTYCQRCGDRRAETALRSCSKCQFDFRSLVGGDQLWQPRPAPSALPAPHAGPPPATHHTAPAPAGQWPAAQPGQWPAGQAPAGYPGPLPAGPPGQLPAAYPGHLHAPTGGGPYAGQPGPYPAQPGPHVGQGPQAAPAPPFPPAGAPPLTPPVTPPGVPMGPAPAAGGWVEPPGVSGAGPVGPSWAGMPPGPPVGPAGSPPLSPGMSTAGPSGVPSPRPDPEAENWPRPPV